MGKGDLSAPGTELAAGGGIKLSGRMRRGGPELLVGRGWQAEVAQNLADHGGVFNGGEDGQGATALWAGGNVDGKSPFE